MPDRELDVGRLTGWGDSYVRERLRAAIDAAVDHGEVTWLTADGRRIARIAPAGDAPAGGYDEDAAEEAVADEVYRRD